MPDLAVILLADDLEDDVLLIRRAFKKGNINNPVHVVRDGEEAICYLKGEGKYSNRDEYPLPDLMLLDLQMPRKDGFEVLRWVRQQPGLAALRIVVLTSSEDLRDVNEAYRLGANSFLVKPLEFENFVETSMFLKHYWLVMNKKAATSRPQKTKPKFSIPRSRIHSHSSDR
jgi:CheY-like chemotaxis protein